MNQFVLTLFALVLLFVALPSLILWARDKILGFGKRRTTEEVYAFISAHQERLRNPKQREVEASLGGLLPQKLLELYESRDGILDGWVEICPPTTPVGSCGELIQDILPLRLEEQQFTCDLEGAGWGKGFCFAGDGCGNFYWMPVDETRQPDAPVYFACHDPWGNEKIAESLEQFLSWPRKPMKRPKKGIL